MNSLDGEVYVKDSSGIIILANEEASSRFKLTCEKMKGKNTYDIFEELDAKNEIDTDNLVVADKFYSGETTELVNNKQVKYFVIKKPLYIPTLKELGILTIRMRKSN